MKAFHVHVSKDPGGEIMFYRCPLVCPSVCTNLTWKHFPTPKLIYLQGSYLVWRHISSICICCYQSSRSSAKVSVKYKGYISQKMAILGAFMFHKHILLLFLTFLCDKEPFCIMMQHTAEQNGLSLHNP